jgi:hypothetical protein
VTPVDFALQNEMITEAQFQRFAGLASRFLYVETPT